MNLLNYNTTDKSHRIDFEPGEITSQVIAFGFEKNLIDSAMTLPSPKLKETRNNGKLILSDTNMLDSSSVVKKNAF